MSDECILCCKIKNETPDRIFMFDSGIALVNFDQRFKGRSILAFKYHVEDIRHIENEEYANFWKDIKSFATAIEKAYHPDRINYSILMNTDPHVHCHIIPRYTSDPNWGRPPWPAERLIVGVEEQAEIAGIIRSCLS